MQGHPSTVVATTAGLTSRRVGVIDIGSNSVRFVIYSVIGAAFAPVYNEKVLAGLGRDLRSTGRLNPDAKVQSIAALKRFSVLAKAHNLDGVLVAATAAMRDASDAAGFIEDVRNQSGLDISPLSGEEEALTSAFGVLAREPRADGIAADLGGASLELVRVKDGHAYGGISHQLGPFAMYDGAFAPQTLRPLIQAKLGTAIPETFKSADTLYLIGGAWRNLATIDQKRKAYPLRVAHNYELNRNDAQVLADWACSPEGTRELQNWPNLSQKRADTLPYSGLMLSILLQKYRPRRIVLAPGGLRDGLIYQDLGRDIQKRDALIDSCVGLSGGHHNASITDASQSTTNSIGVGVFDFLSNVHNSLPTAFELESENRIRRAACLLITMGGGLHPDHRAQIVFEIALYGPLPGLSHKERAYLALILFRAYRSRKTPPDKAAIQYLLTPDEQICAEIYGAAVRASVVLGGRSAEALTLFSLQVDNRDLTLVPNSAGKDLILNHSSAHFTRLADMIGRAFKIKE